MLCKEFLIWAFCDQNVGPTWVSGRKGCFHTSHLATDPVFPKSKVLNSHLKDDSKLKDELTDLHKLTETNH